MREIKFRFWDEKLREMYSWAISKDEPADELFETEGLNPMQYTGLKDKNGKEIYEGDILRFEDRVCHIAWDNENAKFVNVEIEIGEKFSIEEGEPKNQNEMEVIGNIYENKGLLS